MAPFWQKSKSVEELIESYMEQVDECIELFLKALRVWLRKGRTVRFEELVDKVHKAENAADTIRRDVELLLYGKALLPESRGDILGLLETFDKVPNGAETCLFDVSCQRADMPEELAADCLRLAESTVEAYGLLRKAYDTLVNNPRQTLYVVKEVQVAESKVDLLERSLICRIFDEDYPYGRKMLLKGIVVQIGNIADRAENTADRIAIVAIKRKV